MPRRRGFTLVELLIVLLIVSIIAAVTLPVVITSTARSYPRNAARILQGEFAAARARADRDGMSGLRFLPDPAFPLKYLADGTIDPTEPLAFNKVVPLVVPPGVVDGRVSVRDSFPAAFTIPSTTSALILEQEVAYDFRYFDASAGAMVTKRIPNDPTSWAWRVRVGDRVELATKVFIVCGPVATPNPEGYVNYSGAAGTILDRGDGPAEWLLLVNGIDDGNTDGSIPDGIIDNGWNGSDDNYDGVVDDAGEWVEQETWGQIGTVINAPYVIRTRPIQAPGSTGVDLGAAVIDATGWGTTPANDRPRSRLPIDPYGAFVDLVVHPDGHFEPVRLHALTVGAYKGSDRPFFHIWLTDREQVANPQADFGVLVTVDSRTGKMQDREAEIKRQPDGTVDLQATLDVFREAERGQ